ncbi:MAG: fimbrillin family protein [Alistipes sp.]|nr:fimbrillin family protein [Alistipes sp.]
MKRYIGLAALALLVMGCEKEDNYQVEEGAMRIEVLHPSATRATETAFESGDVIGLYATEYSGDFAAPLQISGNWANNVATTYNGSVWTPAKKIFWSENKMDVYGYYPYMTPSSIDEHLWSVQLDQSTPETADALSGYEASDFLWAKATGVEQTNGDVQLQFKHRCSKLVVKLVKGPDYSGVLPTESELYIHSTIPTATLDFVNGAVTKYLYGEMATIKARRVDDATFEAIIVPQRMETRRPFLEYIANGVSYLYESTFIFKAGKLHTLELTINSNPDQIEIEVGGEVTDWE